MNFSRAITYARQTDTFTKGAIALRTEQSKQIWLLPSPLPLIIWSSQWKTRDRSCEQADSILIIVNTMCLFPSSVCFVLWSVVPCFLFPREIGSLLISLRLGMLPPRRSVLERRQLCYEDSSFLHSIFTLTFNFRSHHYIIPLIWWKENQLLSFRQTPSSFVNSLWCGSWHSELLCETFHNRTCIDCVWTYQWRNPKNRRLRNSTGSCVNQLANRSRRWFGKGEPIVWFSCVEWICSHTMLTRVNPIEE